MLVSVYIAACSAPSSEQEPAALDAGSVCADCDACPNAPTAYLLARDDGAAESSVTTLLAQAGFHVEALPLDRSPADLHGLIFIASEASTREDYQSYMAKYGSDLYHFVDRANTLVQMSQPTNAESTPAFLPTTQAVSRANQTIESVTILQQEAELLRGTAPEALGTEILAKTRSVFVGQSGFAVLAAEAGATDHAVLLEGAYGQGRFVLSALPLDEAELQEAMGSFTKPFFANLKHKATAVCARKTEALKLEGDHLLGKFSAGSSSIAVLPDTQVYSLRFPGLFLLQTAWVRENAPALDIRYAIHLGDIVNNNTALEWERAANAMALLHGSVPYALVPGNHDYGPAGDASTRDSLLNDFFDFDAATSGGVFEGAYEDGKLDNTYHLLSIAGHDFIIVALEWGPRDEVIDWANAVMERYPEREGILVTHAYLNNNDRRYDHTDTEHPQQYNPHEYRTPGVNDGEELWQKLVRRHRFVMTLNGHVLGDGTGYLASTTDLGNTCHQMLANYQMREQGGQAYLRLLEFLANGTTVRVHTYSPLLEDFMEAADHSFEFELD